MANVVSPMNNGMRRFVCQLKRLTLQYCNAKPVGAARGWGAHYLEIDPYACIYKQVYICIIKCHCKQWWYGVNECGGQLHLGTLGTANFANTWSIDPVVLNHWLLTWHVCARTWHCLITPVNVYFLPYREYIIEHVVVDFSKENPQCAVYVRFRPGRAPKLIGEYCKWKMLSQWHHCSYMYMSVVDPDRFP